MKQLEKWLTIVVACRNAIEDLAERYPSEYAKLLQEYDAMIEQMYEQIAKD